MQKWIILLLFFGMGACQHQVKEQLLMLDGRLVNPAFAQALINQGELLILYVDLDYQQTKCDSFV